MGPPPPAHPAPPSPLGCSWVWERGCGSPQGCCSPPPPNPPPPSPALLPQQRWGDTEQGGGRRRHFGGGDTHECPSAHGPMWWLLLPGVLGAPLSCLGTKWGQVSGGDRAGGGGTRPPRCRHGRGASGTHRPRRVRRAARPGCPCPPAPGCRWWWGAPAAGDQKMGRTPPRTLSHRPFGRGTVVAAPQPGQTPGDVVTLESALQCPLVAPPR